MNNLENNLVKEGLPPLRGPVHLGNDILGIGSNKLGDRFNLEMLWTESQKISAHRPYTQEMLHPVEVYIRTDDGNIYRVDKEGKFINGKTGSGHTFTRDEMVQDLFFEVGKPFNMKGIDLTPPITEIIYTDLRKRKEDKPMPSSASLIRDDFTRLETRAKELKK